MTDNNSNDLTLNDRLYNALKAWDIIDVKYKNNEATREELAAAWTERDQALKAVQADIASRDAAVDGGTS